MLAVVGLVAADAIFGVWVFRTAAWWALGLGVGVCGALFIAIDMNLIPISLDMQLVAVALGLVWMEAFLGQMIWRARERMPVQVVRQGWIGLSLLGAFTVLLLVFGLIPAGHG